MTVLALSQSVFPLPMPWLFLFATTAGGLLLAAFIHFSKTGTVTMLRFQCYCAVMPSPSHFLLALLPVVDCCLQENYWDTITDLTAWAASMLPLLCHGGDAVAIVPCCFTCAGFLALLPLVGCSFFIIFKSWNIIVQALLHWHHHCTIIHWCCCHCLASTGLLALLPLVDCFLPHS